MCDMCEDIPNTGVSLKVHVTQVHNTVYHQYYVSCCTLARLNSTDCMCWSTLALLQLQLKLDVAMKGSFPKLMCRIGEKSANKLGLNWAKLSSNWNWDLL